MWVITGANGQLGRSMDRCLAARGIEHRSLDRGELDITDASHVARALDAVRPDVIVNTAAWTAVDDAEEHREEAFAVNADGPRNLANWARDHGCVLVHVSTDYVFDGGTAGPHAEDDGCAPRSVYGESKLAGERAVLGILGDGALVVRTAWLYGPDGHNFVKTMIRRALAASPSRVVDDQRGQPTLADDLSWHIVDLVIAGARGVHHGTNSGETTWFGLAREVYGLVGADVSLVTACSSADYPTKALRPRNSVLGHGRSLATGAPPMRNWQDALRDSIGGIRSAVAEDAT